MNRIEIDEQYKWDLSHIVASDQEWEIMFDEIKNSLYVFSTYNGQLGDRALLKQCLDEMNELEMAFGRVFTYAKMHKDEDGKVDKYVGYADRAMALASAISASTSFIVPQLSKMSDEYLNSLITDPTFRDYDLMLKEIIRAKAHILSDSEEKLLAHASEVLAQFKNTFEAFDSVDIDFPLIKLDNKWIKLSHGNYALALQSIDRKVRKDAFESMYKPYRKNINTIASNYAGRVKSNCFIAKMRGYKSALEKELYVEGIPVEVYNNLLQAVNDALPLLHKYIGYRKSYLTEVNMYDMHLPLIEGADIKLDYDSAYNLVINALTPLGQEYQDLLLEAKSGKWIDVYETDAKRSGAYSWGTYGVHPFVLLNYKPITHDVFTIAHEMGHALHSYYSQANLPSQKAEYSIFVAEVASTVNEVLLLKYLLATTADKHIKRYLSQYYIDMFRTTIFRQTQFSEFEKLTHQMVEDGAPLTAKALCDLYYELNTKYYGPQAVHNDSIRYEWARIPHFYNPFYVYKYATGLTTAICLVKDILNGDTTRYLNFLKSGGSKLPYDILVDAGIDLATTKPFEIAMHEFASVLEQLLKQ